MDDLLARVRQYAQRNRLFSPGETVVVGVSGGPDSLCLLHLLRRLAPELRLWLHVAHLHHGLRGADADADATFVAELSDCWGLPCTIGRADVAGLAGEAKLSLEEDHASGSLLFPGRGRRGRRCSHACGGPQCRRPGRDRSDALPAAGAARPGCAGCCRGRRWMNVGICCPRIRHEFTNLARGHSCIRGLIRGRQCRRWSPVQMAI